MFFIACFVSVPQVLAEPINVVTSFSILEDITRNVGKDRIKIHSLVGRNSDAHVYQPTPADVRLISNAQLVIVNGLGFEGWLERLVKSSAYKNRIVVASKGIDLIQKKTQNSQSVDPHAWQDMANTLIYVDNILQALLEIDPAHKKEYQQNAVVYKEKIAALHQEIKNRFKNLPEEKRKVVSSHDAFAYFERAYGLHFFAPAGINSEAEASAADIAKIVRQIRKDKIPAVFMENISSPRLLEQLKRESGVQTGGVLFADTLSTLDGLAPDYLSMMRHNAQTLLDALSK